MIIPLLEWDKDHINIYIDREGKIIKQQIYRDKLINDNTTYKFYPPKFFKYDGDSDSYYLTAGAIIEKISTYIIHVTKKSQYYYLKYGFSGDYPSELAISDEMAIKFISFLDKARKEWNIELIIYN